jgi:hypothetical protein
MEEEKTDKILIVKNVFYDRSTGLYHCVLCDKGFNSLAQSVGHLALCGHKGVFAEDYLDKVMKGIFKIKNVSINREKNLFFCSLCGREFNTIARMKGHLAMCEKRICKEKLAGNW